MSDQQVSVAALSLAERLVAQIDKSNSDGAPSHLAEREAAQAIEEAMRPLLDAVESFQVYMFRDETICRICSNHTHASWCDVPRVEKAMIGWR